MSAIAFAIEVLSVLPTLIQAGTDVIGLVTKTNEALKAMQDADRDPTDAEWAELNELVESLRAQRPNV